MRTIFIAGIGTDVGKTVVSACLAEALQADYWKPIQCGLEPQTDTQLVSNLLSNPISRVHAELFRFHAAISPHAAAQREGIVLNLDKIRLLHTQNPLLIIEGVGGLLVPLNERELCIDLISHFACETVLVARNYLGSINHTLLSVEALRARNHKILGIVFSGEENQSSQKIILEHTKLPLLGCIDLLSELSPASIRAAGSALNLELF